MPKDTWSLRLALRYFGLPDVAGGVVPAPFVQHLEALLTVRLAFSLDTDPRRSLVLLHRGRWQGDDTLVFDGVCVAPRPADAEASPWYRMPRYFANLFAMERWPRAYRAWGQGMIKDATEIKQMHRVDGDRIFRVVSALDALHQEARRSLDRMFDNARRREAGHSFMERGRQAALVRQYMTDMVDQAAHHKRSLPHTSSGAWLGNYRDTLDTALRRARRRGVDRDVGNVSGASSAAAAMHGIMGALAARMYRGVGDILSDQFRLAQFRDHLYDMEHRWLHPRPVPPDYGAAAGHLLGNRAWWDRIDLQ